MEVSVKNKLDSLFFTRLFVPERHKYALMADEKPQMQFLIAPSRKRSGMEIYYVRCMLTWDWRNDAPAAAGAYRTDDEI